MGQAGNLGSGQSDVLQQCSLAGAGAEDIVRTLCVCYTCSSNASSVRGPVQVPRIL